MRCDRGSDDPADGRSSGRRSRRAPAMAEDLVHDTFVALPRAIRGFRGEASLRSFLIGVAVNHAKRHIRTAVRRRRATEKLAAQQELLPSTIDATDVLA